MLLFIIFVALLIIGIVLVIISKHKWNFDYGTLGWFLTIINGSIVSIMLLVLAIQPTEFKYNEEEYNNLKAQVETVTYDDIVTSDNLRNQVLDMNNDIARHKHFSKNIFIGMFYSKHLGELEPLHWQSKVFEG